MGIHNSSSRQVVPVDKSQFNLALSHRTLTIITTLNYSAFTLDLHFGLLLTANMGNKLMALKEELLENAEEALMNDPVFKRRTMDNFDFMDSNKNGILTMKEIMWYARNLQKYTGKTEAEIEPFRRVLRDCFTVMGVTDKGAKRDEWLAKHAHFCVEEMKLMKAGKKTRMRRLFDSFFSYIDVNHDSMLTKAEFGVFAKCVGWPEDMAAKFFQCADKNNNGWLEVEEFHSACNEWWYYSNPAYDKLYGNYF